MRLQLLLCLCALLALAVAWTKEDHEIFRLRDEVLETEGDNVTFYDFIGVKPNSVYADIEKAFRKRSRQIHPDKARQSFIASYSKHSKSSGSGNDAHSKKKPTERELKEFDKQANDRYARLSVVAKILTSEQRQRYDHFMSNGFPRWRGTGYYYTRFRPGVGTVLLGLLVAIGGFAHYGALYLSWRRNRDFVNRYIRYARRAAWGDETGIPGISSVDPDAGNGTVEDSQTTQESVDGGSGHELNRKQRRQQEKASRKGTSKGSQGTSSPKVSEVGSPQDARLISGPAQTRKKVVAENGKTLIVDSAGNVYLEAETEEGEVHEYLLDADDIPPPTFKDTVLVRLPLWIFSRITGKSSSIEVDEPLLTTNSHSDPLSSATAPNPNAEVRSRKAKAKPRGVK